MVKSCAANNCNQRYEKGISFHQFPDDKTLLNQWLQAMRRNNWTPSKSSLICSKHFTEDCYEKSRWSSKRRLKPTAVPSVFPFPKNLEKKKSFRSLTQEKNSLHITELSVRDFLEICIEESEEKYDPQMQMGYYVGDFHSTNENVSDIIGQCINASKEIVSQKKSD